MPRVTADPARPTLAACEWTLGGRPLADAIAAVAATGYDALLVVGEPARTDLDELARLLGEAGLTVAGTTSETAGNPTRDLAHPQKALRNEAVAYFQGCIDLVARLGASTMGIVPSAEGRLGPVSSYAEEWQHAVRTVRELALYAGERAVRLAIEPLNRYEAFLVNRVEQACALAADVGVDGVGVIADFFHMNIEEPDPLEAIDLAGDQLLELHLADSNREGLGSGHLPARELLERARDRGFGAGRTLAVECFARAWSTPEGDEAGREDAFLAQCARVAAEVFVR